VNGSSITLTVGIDPISYFHLELAEHDVIFAEGAAAETFVDCDSRGMFHNAREFSQLYPGDAAPRWTFCAPMVERGRSSRRSSAGSREERSRPASVPHRMARWKAFSIAPTPRWWRVGRGCRRTPA
jgi:hypothetical protein